MRLATMLAAAIFCVAGTQSCTPKKSKSNVDSLDNLASGRKVTENVCKGPAALASDLKQKWSGRINFGTDIKEAIEANPQAKAKYLEAMDSYLSAVPAELQNAFLNFGGEILLTGQALANCNIGVESKGIKSFGDDKSNAALNDSCFIYASGSDDNAATRGKSVMVIEHQINLKEIADGQDANVKRLMHGGVRAFGMVFSQFYSKLALKNGTTVAKPNNQDFILLAKDTFEMSSLKEQLANRFIIDVATSNGKYDLVNLESLLGKGSAQKIMDSLKANPEMKAAIEKHEKPSAELVSTLKPLDAATFIIADKALVGDERDAQAAQFKDFVFGEGMDSLHCSDASRQVLDSDFVVTKDLLRAASSAMVTFAKQISGSQAIVPQARLTDDVGSSDEGLGLVQGGNPQQDYINGLMYGNMFRGLFGMFGSMASMARPLATPTATNAVSTLASTCKCPGCPSCLANGCKGCTGGACAAGTGFCSGGSCSAGGSCPGGNCGAAYSVGAFG